MDFQKYSELSHKNPSREDFTQVFVSSKDEFIGKYSLAQYKELKGTFPANCTIEKIVDENGFKEALNEFNLANQEFENLFWKDAFEELKINPNHPKINELKKLAWDYGHSNGLAWDFGHNGSFSDVFWHLQNFSMLIC